MATGPPSRESSAAPSEAIPLPGDGDIVVAAEEIIDLDNADSPPVAAGNEEVIVEPGLDPTGNPTPEEEDAFRRTASPHDSSPIDSTSCESSPNYDGDDSASPSGSVESSSADEVETQITFLSPDDGSSIEDVRQLPLIPEVLRSPGATARLNNLNHSDIENIPINLPSPNLSTRAQGSGYSSSGDVHL